MPMAIALSAARVRGIGRANRPIGRPTKMVEPAIAPRISSFVVDIGRASLSDGKPTIVRGT